VTYPRIGLSTPQDLERALEAAEKGFLAWRDASPQGANLNKE
jgi:hypothetical protein